MAPKKKSPPPEKDQFLDQLDYQTRARLVTLDLKNPIEEPFNKENSNNLIKELPHSFVELKLSSDKNYSLKEEVKEEVKEAPTASEDTTIDDTNVDQIPTGDPFLNLDQRLNIKENLNFFNSHQEEVSIDNEDIDGVNKVLLDSADSSEMIASKEEGAKDPEAPPPVEISEAPETSETPEAPEEFSFDKPEPPASEDVLESSNFLDDHDGEEDIFSRSTPQTPQEKTAENLVNPANPVNPVKVENEIEEVPEDLSASISDSIELPDEPSADDTDGEHLEVDKIEKESVAQKKEEKQTPVAPLAPVAPVLEETAPDSNLTEEGLYQNFQQSADQALDIKYYRNKIDKIITGFDPQNQKTILFALDGRGLSDEDKSQVIDDILSQKNENIIVEFINQSLLQKTGYEVLERREKTNVVEKKILSRAYSKYKTRRNIFLLVFTSLTMLLVVFSLNFFYKNIVSKRLYDKSIQAVDAENYQDAEKLFSEAYTIKPNIDLTSELSTSYLKKKQFAEAENKITLLLKDYPDDVHALVAASRFYRLSKRFEEAQKILTQAKIRFFGNPIQENEAIELLIAEGKSLKDSEQAKRLWTQAEKILSDQLIRKNIEKNIYIPKRLQLASLQKNFEKSKKYFAFFETLKIPYPVEPLGDYLDYLLEMQEQYRQDLLLKPGKKGSEQQNTYAISIINKILMNLEKNKNAQYFLEASQARWAKINNKLAEAKIRSQKSIDLILKEKNYLLTDALIRNYNLLGSIYLQEKDVFSGINAFQNGLDLDPQNPEGNYYLSKINLLNLNYTQTAYSHSLTAYQEWKNKDDVRYADLLYIMGYINFINGKNNTNGGENQLNYFKDSVAYWSELSKIEITEKDYLITFNIATGYLYLHEFDLAEIFYKNNLDDLKTTISFYQEQSEDVLKNTTLQREELTLLSDVYNNLGVTLIGKNSKRSSVPVDITGEAMVYFINSIVVKDKIGEIKGTPYANFNTLNDYPKHSLAFVSRRPFQIADTSIPKSLLPETF